MDTAQQDLNAWRDTLSALADIATKFPAEHGDANSVNFESIKDARRLEREAWQRYRKHWKDSGQA